MALIALLFILADWFLHIIPDAWCELAIIIWCIAVIMQDTRPRPRGYQPMHRPPTQNPPQSVSGIFPYTEPSEVVRND